jgi:hypothetical protein
MSSYSHPAKNNQESDNTNIPIEIHSTSSANLLMSNATISSNGSSQQPPANKRVVKSCLWSTVIFSINFVSSILVINLAKW